MAEDLQNPLNNPAVSLPTHEGPPAAAPPEANPELDGFLDDYFSPEATTGGEPETPTAPLPESAPPAARPAPTAVAATPLAEPTPAPALPGEPGVSQPPADDLQRQVMQELLSKLQTMPQQPDQAAQQPQAPQVTPATMRQQMQPLVEQLVQAGWIDEDYAALYPQQAANMAWQYSRMAEMTQAAQHILAYINTAQTRDVTSQADRTLDTAIDEVAAKGDIFETLKTPEVRKGFRDYLIELNPHMSQLTPDFLARQYYAYNHELILNTVKQAQAQPRPSAGTKAQQESGGTRPAPQAQPQEDWADMIAGVLPGL